MKIAIAATGNTMESQVDRRFARALKFILVDTDTGAFEAHDNSANMNAAHGAGTQAAALVSQLGAQAVIAGDCGPKALSALQAAGIQVYVNFKGTVAEAVDAFRAGRLTPAHSP